MFDCPETSHTSPTRTSLSSILFLPSMVIEPGVAFACIASSRIIHFPSLSAVVLLAFPAKRTVTGSPASAVPQIGTARSRCNPIASLITSGSTTFARTAVASSNSGTTMKSFIPTCTRVSSLFQYFRYLHVRVVRHPGGHAVLRAQLYFFHRPVQRVFDHTGRAALHGHVAPLQIDDRLFRQPAGREDLLRARGFHIFDRDVAKFAESACRRHDRRTQHCPVGRHILDVFRQRHIAVRRIPVQVV